MSSKKATVFDFGPQLLSLLHACSLCLRKLLRCREGGEEAATQFLVGQRAADWIDCRHFEDMSCLARSRRAKSASLIRRERVPLGGLLELLRFFGIGYASWFRP